MNGLPQGKQVRAALEDLLAWPPIARSPQLAKFLGYIVVSTLEGQDAQIKAYSIAVDVFGRPTSFDPQHDPIVRVQARRLRTLLDQYYEEGHGSAGVRIQLPVGRYVPEFLVEENGANPDLSSEATEILPEAAPVALPTPVGPLGWPVQAAIAGILTLALGIGLLFATLRPNVETAAPAPAEPTLLVGQFSNLTGTPDLDSFGLQVSSAVRESLAPFEDVLVMPDDPTRGAARIPAGAYLLSGVVHPAPPGIEVTATLSNGDGETLWNATYPQPSPLGRGMEAVAAIARSIARELAPFRGPVHAVGRAWLDEQQRPLAAVNTYVCFIAYHLARESGASAQIADALACLERLLRDDPDNALALSASAWLEMRAIIVRAVPARSLAGELDRPLQLAERALGIDPDSSIVYEHLGAVNNWLGRFEEAERDFVRSLELNPLNTDARAGYGIMLGRASQWAQGNEQATIAIADTPHAPAWYYYPVALYDFRLGRFSAALDAARRAMQCGAGEAGTIIAIASAQSLGLKDVIAELQPRLMSIESLRRSGIMPWFAFQISDPEVLASVATKLGRAGISEAALTGTF